MGDTGGKSGRRPGRHLQVEASGPRNVASVHSAPRVDPNASAWGCASEGWAGSPATACGARPWGPDGACEPPRLSIYPADADLQFCFLTCAPYRALWGIVFGANGRAERLWRLEFSSPPAGKRFGPSVKSIARFAGPRVNISRFSSRRHEPLSKTTPSRQQRM